MQCVKASCTAIVQEATNTDCNTATCNIQSVIDCPSATCDVTVTDNCPSATCNINIQACDLLVKSCRLDDCVICCEAHQSGFYWNNWCLCPDAELIASGSSYGCDNFDPADSARNACDCSYTESWKFRGTGRYTISIPEDKPLEAVILWGHNLADGADGVNAGRVWVWDENGNPIQPINWDLPYATVEEDEPIFMLFDGSLHNTITIGATGATNNLDATGSGDELCQNASTPTCIDNIFIGECMMIPEGLRKFQNPFNASEYEAKIKSSACGPLSRKLKRKAIEFDLTLEGLCYDWLVEVWRPFLCYLQRYPVYFAWSKNRYPNEIARVWMDDCVEPSEFTDSHFSSINIPLKAHISHGSKTKG